MLNNPHDALFKAVFEHPENAAAELEHILDRDLAASIDWSSLALEPGSYVDPALANSHSDLLFSGRTQAGGQQFLVYLLFEHQSSHDATMALRLLSYMVRIWSRFTREHPTRPLPVILPALLAQVPGRWRATTRFSELFSTDLGPLAAAIPDFSHAVDGLARADDHDLRRRPLANHARLALWLLRDAQDAATLLRSTPAWTGALEALAQSAGGPEALTALLRDTARVSNDLRLSDSRAIYEQHAPTAESLTMTIAEQRLAEGLAEGEARGLAKALHAVVLARGLHITADAEHRIQICSDPDTLQL